MRAGSTGWPQSSQSTLPVGFAIGCSNRESALDLRLPVALRPGFFLFGAFRPGVSFQPSGTFPLLKTIFVSVRYHLFPLIARNKTQHGMPKLPENRRRLGWRGWRIGFDAE